MIDLEFKGAVTREIEFIARSVPFLSLGVKKGVNSISIKKKSLNNYSKFNSKKAISPVVATALLLVVAVVAVVGFQGWFSTFSSSLFTNTETQSTTLVGNTQIDTIIGNSLYFKNGNTNNLSVIAVKVNGVNCNYSGNLTVGITEINIANCTQNLTTSTPEVVVYTQSGIYSKKYYVKTDLSSSGSASISVLNCSALGLAGGTWITVPGNSALGTSDFCVMKYGAKNLTNIATSQAALSPWVSINLTNARNNCTGFGSRYHLITNAEWTTIARNVELVGSNWNSTVVGSGFMFSGHNDNNPANALAASTNDSDGYNGTNDGISSPGDGSYTNFLSNDARAYMGQKRTLVLNNSEIIWDLSGNVYGWTNDTCTQGDPWYSTGAWIDWTNVNINTIEKTLGGPIGNYTASNSIGRYYGCTTLNNGFLRGGSWAEGAGAGVFYLNLVDSPSAGSTAHGFRCAYTP